jgi:hypothetical protein
MNHFKKSILLLIITGLASCEIIRETPKYQFADGYYNSNIFHHNIKKVYVNYEEDVIQVYPLRQVGKQLYEIDTSIKAREFFPELKTGKPTKKHIFRQSSFDIDILAVPFKYRFPTQDFPRQLNSSLSGALYLGYRTDAYHIRYKVNPIGQYVR